MCGFRQGAFTDHGCVAFAGTTSLQASSGAANALSSLFSLPSFGKRKLLAN